MVQAWLKVSGMLCLFGLLREMRPSEPYITEYLLGDWRNITQEQVNRDIYPVGTYSYLSQLVVVFLITDCLRYKPLIIISGVTGVVVWSLLIWTTSLVALQITEFFYGTYMAVEVAYYTYIYAKVEKQHYPQVTSHTRAAMFMGKFMAGISAQLLIYFQLMDYKELNYITLATQILATIWAFRLPKVENSLYFHRNPTSNSNKQKVNPQTRRYANEVKTDDATSLGQQSVEGLITITPVHLLWKHFCNAYTSVEVVKWSFCYAAMLCGYLQVYSYVQVLWRDIVLEPGIMWNGAVDAIFTALATLSALSAGYLHANYLKPRIYLLLVATLTAAQGAAVLLSCWTTYIYVSYVGFILFGALYSFVITMASVEIARHLEDDSFGLVFGINTLFALIMQTILTLLVVSQSVWTFSAVEQYTVYAFYFIGIAGIILVSNVIECLIYQKNAKSHDIDFDK